MKDKDGKPKYEEEVREKGRANIEWLEAKGLTEISCPSDWMNALLLETHKMMDPKLMVTIGE